MFCDVHEPCLIEPVGGEVTADQVVTDCSTGTATPGLTRHDRRTDPRDLAQSPHAPFRHLISEVTDIVREDPISALLVIFVKTPEHLDEVPLFTLTR